MHPSASQKDNVPGFIALLHQKAPTNESSSSALPPPSSLLLAWIPEAALGDAYDTYVKVDLSDGGSPPRQSYLVPPPPAAYNPGSSSMDNYAFALPVSQIYSLLIRPPNLGWWYGSIVVNSRAGDSFPALFFHDSECASTIAQGKRRAKDSFDPFGEQGGLFWGGDEVLRWLRKYVRVEKSQVEPMLYMVDPTAEDLTSFVTKSIVDKRDAGGESSAGMDPITKVWKEARWNLLEKLTRVTRFTRRTAEDTLDNPRVPPQVRALLKAPEVLNVQDEFDSARLYLARWAMGIAEAAEKDQRQRVWTHRDLQELEDSDVGEFEILDLQIQDDAFNGSPITLSEWNRWQDQHGELTLTTAEIKARIFHTGCTPDARKEIWLFLLDVYPWNSASAERNAIMNSKRDEYLRLKAKWWDNIDHLMTTDTFRDEKARIEKDVRRTDRTIPLFAGEDIPHPDPESPFADTGTNVHMEQMNHMLLTYNESNSTLGYVQGMSDLLSPLYAVFQDDAVAFTAFVPFMARVERNFLRDQSGMRAQLITLDHLVQLLDPKLYAHLAAADSTNFFFLFRMLLVWFKREFDWDDILRLWEALWTNLYSSQFHLFIAMAILDKHRRVIMEYLKHSDEVLKYFNELSGNIDVKDTLVRAEALWKRFRRTVEEVDRKVEGLGKVRGKGKEKEKEKGKDSEPAQEGESSKDGPAAADKIPAISEELRLLMSTEVIRA